MLGPAAVLAYLLCAVLSGLVGLDAAVARPTIISWLRLVDRARIPR